MQKDIPQQESSPAPSNIAIVAYITFIGLIIAFVMNDQKEDVFVSFHIQQSLGLTLIGVVLGILSIIPVIGWILYILGFIVLLYMWIVGLMNAIKQKLEPVPFLGEKFSDWFKKI
tara:strand:+ start:129368 stop:129712 length:345 start_codon:yes stop_codon:yes gene_type:complete